ncbi:sensor domain-containing phosphodiesterase [Halomonas dongshanensis]|uniref:EAL domain-containing protein n=1 Tax=Halomonas dongshanensis TaxID=2890835 RepID=A0ABT2ECY3_9GAMM|nr:EAL domain-containing protein [Halomonas dongshanensis]MCS2608512.1 EAL domain-containing protein [Halomonas dongshanensis]
MSISYPLPDSEEKRLQVLAEYHMMDTPAEDDFDRLTHLASCLFDVPIVLVTLLDRDRQFFKSKIGFDVCETSREVSFCTHAIMQDDTMVIFDALKDARFSTNPLVLGYPFIRFYAGKPLKSPAGENIGTVCLIDTKPRQEFTDKDRKNLADLAALVMDRMELRRLDFVKSINQARFENIAATSPDAIICSNSEGGITFWNRSAERIFGYSAQEAVEKTTEIIVPDSWRVIYEDELKRLKQGCKLKLADRTVELSGLRKDGSEFPAEFSLSTWNEGDSTSVGAIVRDITERRQNEERLFRLASLDALTDLPNRSAWRERLNQTLAANLPATVLLLDLDGFKEVNDTLGHSAGDAVLKSVAQRLKSTCTDAIMVARLGGDEFVALIPGNDERQANAIASRLVAAITDLYEFSGQTVEIGVSIGVSFSPQHSTTPEELLGSADLALYRAKATGKGHYEIFEPSLREVATARRAFQKELRNAFEHEEFELYYQPQVSTYDRRLLGAEALLRWNHPGRGLLTPDTFIEILGQKSSAVMVGEWILRSACQQAAQWRNIIPDFTIGVNLFESQFRSGSLPQTIHDILDEYHLPPEALELELVENILLHTDAKTLKLIYDLRDIGIGLAFDDYGTGFASLSLLKKFPVTRLKIDRSFIRNVTTSSEDAAVVKAILYLARSFDMSVIAEGVENEAQLSFLKEHHCLEAQGYLFGRPVPAKDFILPTQ